MAVSLPVTIIAAPTDVDFARRLQTDLGMRGVPTAVESSDLHPSPPHFAEALTHLLERASVCLVLLSPAAFSADLIAQVQRAVVTLQAGTASVNLLFISLVPAGSLPLPFPLASFPLLDLTRLPYDAALSSIQAQLRPRTITGAPAPQPPAPHPPVPSAPEAPAPYVPPAPPTAPPPPASPAGGAPMPPPPAPAISPAGAPPQYPAPAPYGSPPSYSSPPRQAPLPESRPTWPSERDAGERSTRGTFPGVQREKNAPSPAHELPLEQATFTAYHPKEMHPRVWQPLLVYIALDTPAALAQVSAAANERLAGRREQFRAATAGEATGLRRGSKLTIVPEIPGFRANPPEMTVAWEEDAQQHEFRLRAETARAGQAANGRVNIYMGPILRGEIPVSIYVQPSGVIASLPDSYASVVARAYRKVFASYSHRDTSIVRSCETAAQTMGDRYLRDVTLLRSGEHWDERLLDAVTEADIFQLFWSEHAAKSPAVEKEWRRALSLVPIRGQFIRPVYWSREPYSLPPELAAIHFEKLDLARLGWGPARAFLYTVLGVG